MIGAVTLSAWDWGILLWFLAVTTGVGLYYARRAGSDLQEYFLSGRSLPWWALGTSIVATTFAADTPLAVAGFVISGGVAKNWIWWSFLFGGTLTVFLFSRFWRRAAVVTEIELIALRYDGGAARALRGFKAVFLGLVVNSIIFGFVTKAMLSIVAVLFPDVPGVWALTGLLALTLVYTALSGLWGVVATDVLQFVMAMLGAVLLAVLAVQEVGGLDAMVERVRATVAAEAPGRDLLSIIPTGWDAFTAGVVILALVNWWAVYYPGAEPGGGGYVVQRMSAALDERHARGGNLWFIVAHYVLRPWPWILVGLCAVVLEPRFLEAVGVAGDLRGDELDAALAGAGLTDFHPADKAYPWMFHLLPVGLLGLVAASFLAAFMSTITTTLNLSASYLVNDLYLPFLAPRGENVRHQVFVARLTIVLVMACGAGVSWLLVSVGEGWTMIMKLTAGTGLVLILRWLWWRVSAWTEIAAMLGSAVAFLLVWYFELDAKLAAATGGPGEQLGLLLVVAGSTVTWVAVTLVTRPTSDACLEAFYRRVRPGGRWGPVAARLGMAPHPFGRDLAMWGASTVLVFGALFGLGSLLLGDSVVGSVCVVVAAIAGAVLVLLLRSEARAEASAERATDAGR